MPYGMSQKDVDYNQRLEKQFRKKREMKKLLEDPVYGEKLLNMHWQETELGTISPRSLNILIWAKGTRAPLKDILTLTEHRLLSFRSCGKKSVAEINEKLKEMGLHLGMQLPEEKKIPT